MTSLILFPFRLAAHSLLQHGLHALKPRLLLDHLGHAHSFLREHLPRPRGPPFQTEHALVADGAPEVFDSAAGFSSEGRDFAAGFRPRPPAPWLPFPTADTSVGRSHCLAVRPARLFRIHADVAHSRAVSAGTIRYTMINVVIVLEFEFV